MDNQILKSRLGGTAIVAVLALTSTPALAQEATPQEVPQITLPQEAPDPVSITATPDPFAAEPEDAAEPEPAVGATGSGTATASPTVRRNAPRVQASSRAVTSVPASSEPPVPAATTNAPVDDTASAPLVDAGSEPLPAAIPSVAAPVANTAVVGDETVPIAAGAGLGLLALGGAAFAMRRRRRDRAEEPMLLNEPTIARGPAPSPAPVVAERSAFAWGNAQTSPTGKSWVDRAHRGPTPENPFLSLKKRLQRAAFYDQRERAVAAGRALPLSPTAGLPNRFVDAIRGPTAQPAYGFSYAPA